MLQKIGSDNAVNFTKAEIKAMENGVLTHNHPNGGCFSPHDINMLRRGKLSEVRAVTSDGVYSIQAPKAWPSKLSSLSKISDEYDVFDRIESQKYFDQARMGTISLVQADKLGQKATVEALCREHGIPFKFETWADIEKGLL